jgi:quercetin dioxygenase-like cupin family protein
MARADDPTPADPVTRAVLLDAQLRQAKDTGRIQAHEVRILPGCAVGRHVHNGPVAGTILEGSVVYQIEGREAQVLQAGDIFLEHEGQRIARFDAGDDGATFLAFYLLSLGQEPKLTVLG